MKNLCQTDPINLYVGHQLKIRRKAFKFSQTDLGDKLGITYQQVQKYESGANKVSPSTMVKLSKVLNVPITYFYPEDVHQAQNRNQDDLLTGPEAQALHVLRNLNHGLRQSVLNMINELGKVK